MPQTLPNASPSDRFGLAIRSLRPIGSAQNLLLTIPGGPGISSRYLDGFLASLDFDSSWNVAVIDLPGHGTSDGPGPFRTIQYPQLLQSVSRTVSGIAREHQRVVVWGQSLGGRIALDLLGEESCKAAALFLTGAPLRFEPSSVFQRKFAELGIDFARATAEGECAKLWRRMIPLYFKRQPSAGELAELSAETCFLHTSHMLEGAQSTPTSPRQTPPILFLEGTADSIVPDENIDGLRGLYPWAEFKRVRDAGHFPMLEQAEAVRDALHNFINRMGH